MYSQELTPSYAKEILSPRRASVPSATGRRIEGRPSLDTHCLGISRPTPKGAEEKNLVSFCFPTPLNQAKTNALIADHSRPHHPDGRGLVPPAPNDQIIPITEASIRIRIHGTPDTPYIAGAKGRTVSAQKGCHGGQPFRFTWCQNGLRNGRVVDLTAVDRDHPFPHAMRHPYRHVPRTCAAMTIVGLKGEVIDPPIAGARSFGSNRC